MACKEDEEQQHSIGTFTIITISSEILKFKSYDAFIIFKWINFLLTQLKKKSTYAVAIRSFSKEASSDEAYLELKKGDLILLDQPGKESVCSGI